MAFRLQCLLQPELYAATLGRDVVLVKPGASLQEIVTAAFEHLSPKQRRVARFLAANEVMVAFTTATTLAQRLEVDPATVVRLTRSLGFRGYPDLQRHLRARFPHHYPALTSSDADRTLSDGSLVARAFAQDHDNLRTGLESLDGDAFEQCVDLIGRAKRILLFGGGVATGLVYFLGSSLRTMGFPVHYAASDGIPVVQELISLTRSDLALGVGFYRYVGLTVRILERARALGVPRVVVTDSPLSPLVSLADCALCAPVESTSHRVSLVAPMALANALVAACATRYADQVGAALRRLDDEYRAAGLLTEG